MRGLAAAREIIGPSDVRMQHVVLIGVFVLLGVLGWLYGTQVDSRRRKRRFRLFLHAWLVGWVGLTGSLFAWALVQALGNA